MSQIDVGSQCRVKVVRPEGLFALARGSFCRISVRPRSAPRPGTHADQTGELALRNINVHERLNVRHLTAIRSNE
jgi:hypothetical protein